LVDVNKPIIYLNSPLDEEIYTSEKVFSAVLGEPVHMLEIRATIGVALFVHYRI
jgi:hypothetical protein